MVVVITYYLGNRLMVLVELVKPDVAMIIEYKRCCHLIKDHVPKKW